ncbi:MAG: hypothetical protein ACLFVJ_08630 [Persicimonas sp.]
MDAMIKRLVAILAALLLAGAVVGCEREDTQMGDQEQPPMGEQQEEEPAVGEPTAEQEPPEDQPPQAAEQEQAMEDLREHVSDELDIPASAVMFEDDMRTRIEQAQFDFKRESLATIGAVDYYANRLDTEELDSEQQEAMNTVEQNSEQAGAILEQMESEDQANYDELESQVEEHLDEVSDNWEELSDEVEPLYEQQPAGGGPMEGQDQMDQPTQDPEQQDSPGQPTEDY